VVVPVTPLTAAAALLVGAALLLHPLSGPALHRRARATEAGTRQPERGVPRRRTVTSSRSVLAVAACAATTLALLPGTAPASAAPGGTAGARTSASQAASPSGTVSDLTLSTSAVTVDGFAVAPVMVEFTLTGGPVDATGVVLLRTTTTWDVNAPRHLPARVTRVDGTVGNGTYRGTLQVPSTAHGGWRVSSVGFGNDGGYPQDPTPAIDLREQGLPDVLLDVSGTHRPRFRFDRTVPTYPSTTVTLRGTLTDSDTGRPLKGRRVSFGIDSQCTEDGLPAPGRPVPRAGPRTPNGWTARGCSAPGHPCPAPRARASRTRARTTAPGPPSASGSP
jgi:hypothetical protein